jgi:hypothetical protein
MTVTGILHRFCLPGSVLQPIELYKEGCMLHLVLTGFTGIGTSI